MKKTLLAVLLGSFALASFAQPITIEKQGAFSAGGTVIEAKKTFDPYHPEPDAMTLHGDHANVIYQIPAHAKNVSLMFLHGAGQSMRTWQTTPDGREGFQSVFLRKGYPVYLIDLAAAMLAGQRSTERLKQARMNSSGSVSSVWVYGRSSMTTLPLQAKRISTPSGAR